MGFCYKISSCLLLGFEILIRNLYNESDQQNLDWGMRYWMGYAMTDSNDLREVLREVKKPLIGSVTDGKRYQMWAK